MMFSIVIARRPKADAAIQFLASFLDCFATLAMTNNIVMPAKAGIRQISQDSEVQ
jgi:hypothetical protein